MNPQTSQYHAIIVHYGNPQITQQAVNALKCCYDPPNHIVIIDHADQPLRLDKVHNIHLIRPAQNLGYAAGLNRGLGVLHSIGAKGHDVIICLNNDVIFPADAMQHLRHWWQKNPAPALVGLVTHHQRETVSHGQVNLLSGRTSFCGDLHQKLQRTFSVIPYIHGAAFAAPFELLMKNKGIPEHYFMYWEDALFSMRLLHNKIPLRVATSVKLSHYNHSDLSTPSDDKTYYLVRNGALTLAKETTTPWRIYWWLANRLRYLYHLNFSHPRQPVVIEALKDAINGQTGPRPSRSPITNNL